MKFIFLVDAKPYKKGDVVELSQFWQAYYLQKGFIKTAPKRGGKKK